MEPFRGMGRDMRDELQRVADWARERLDSGAEPPTAYYRLMQLIEAADALRNGLMAMPREEGSPELAEQQETVPPQAGEVVRLDSVRRHRDDSPINLPT